MAYKYKIKPTPVHEPKMHTIACRDREWEEERCAVCKMKYPCPTVLNN